MRFLGVRTLAALAAVIGLIDVAAAGAGRQSGRAHAAVLIAGAPIGRRQALVFGVLLLALAHGVAGRRRLAHRLALAALIVAGLRALHGAPGRLAVLGALIVAVAALHAEFPTRPDARRLRLAGQLGLGVLGLIVLGAGWDVGVRRAAPREFGESLLAGFTTAAPAHIPLGSMLAMLVAAGGLAVLLLALAAAPAPPPGTGAQRAQVALLARQPGADSLAPFATRRDKSYVFSPDGRAAIGYKVLLGTALAGGDPVGDPAGAPAAIEAFQALCRRHGWRPAVLGASDAMLPHWRGIGLTGLVVGDEAVLDLARFSLASRRMRNVRQAVGRSRNAGVTVSIGPLTTELADRLRPVLAGWLGAHAERGFAMNLDHILVPRPDCLIAVGYGPDGEPAAFARFGVVAGGRILTLDVAPRRRDAPNGIVERLIIEMVDYGRGHGAVEVSLNFAGLRQVFERPGPLYRGLAAGVHALDRWIELGPLYRFCAKFQPSWRPRSLLFGSWFALGVVGTAALLAEFGSAPAAQPAGSSITAVDQVPARPAGNSAGRPAT
jgi:lysyl-tRNA synthetase class 2